MPVEPLTRPDARLVHVQVDGRRIVVAEGTTVLHAAELAGVSIPSLCAHKELSPFGGCRLCAVEIEGMRGYPLACSTYVQAGMEVTTESDPLVEMRREILQLILSQHPASCLICDEKDECRRSQATIRKAGVSTGCRSCPNDGDCELQGLAQTMGITEIGYPVSYRGLEAEHDDPFFDRDYNLCILCGRCVRMCHEVRGAAVLSFKYRGRKALVGPAFGQSHAEAGCEFCGACVSVCPTGALADKVSKWDGKPDGVETSTCPFCGIGCRLDVAHRDGALSAVRGAHDAEINDGQLCLRGRFCLPEATHHHSRARKPMVRRGAYLRVAGWDEALAEVAQRLAGTPPDELHMLVSSDLSNEGLYAAQRLMRLGLGAIGVDSTARSHLSGGPALWSRLFSLPISIKALSEAEAVIVAGIDTRFSFSVVGVQVRRALRRGARLVAVDARETNLTRMADQWLRARPGQEAMALSALLKAFGGGEPPGARLPGVTKQRLAASANRVQGARTLAVVIGPRVFDCPGAAELVAGLEALAGREGTTVLPLAHGANLRGALELGALGNADDRRPPKVVYFVGEAPFRERPDCDFLIAQDLYLPPFDVDVFLPAASFAEADGTLTNLEGRVQEIHAVEQRPADAVRGFALPDWQIFSDLAGHLGRPDLQYADAAAVRAVMRAEVPDVPAEHDRSRRRMSAMMAAAGAGSAPAPGGDDAPSGRGRFLLVPERAAFRHRGIDLADVVEGLQELHLEEGLFMNPDDAVRLGVEAGGAVTVSADGVDLVRAARPDPDCPRGTVYASGLEREGLPLRPVRVRIRPGDRARPRGRAGAIISTPGGGDGPGR
jgi:formate dehydrogenase alpha subunit